MFQIPSNKQSYNLQRQSSNYAIINIPLIVLSSTSQNLSNYIKDTLTLKHYRHLNKLSPLTFKSSEIFLLYGTQILYTRLRHGSTAAYWPETFILSTFCSRLQVETDRDGHFFLDCPIYQNLTRNAYTVYA
jgi:hypothetical protein